MPSTERSRHFFAEFAIFCLVEIILYFVFAGCIWKVIRLLSTTCVAFSNQKSALTQIVEPASCSFETSLNGGGKTSFFYSFCLNVSKKFAQRFQLLVVLP